MHDAWGRYRKFVASTTAKNPVDPFIDPEGYRAFIDAAEAEFRRGRGALKSWGQVLYCNISRHARDV